MQITEINYSDYCSLIITNSFFFVFIVFPYNIIRVAAAAIISINYSLSILFCSGFPSAALINQTFVYFSA